MIPQIYALLFTSAHQWEPRDFWFQYSYGRWKTQVWRPWRWDQVRLHFVRHWSGDAQALGRARRHDKVSWPWQAMSMSDTSGNPMNTTPCLDQAMCRPYLMSQVCHWASAEKGPRQYWAWIRSQAEVHQAQTLIPKPQGPDKQISDEQQVY